MELSSLLSGGHNTSANNLKIDTTAHSYSSRHTMSGVTANDGDGRMTTPPAPAAENHLESTTPHNTNMSPYGSPKPKSVAFELLFPESPQFRARLPMRVQIFPHDTTDSIVTTVKNFYGLYAGPSGAKGISFEDELGNTLIARYENLRNNMVVYIRVIDDSSHTPVVFGPTSCNSASPVIQQGYYTSGAHQMPPSQPAQVLNYGQPPSRPTSRTSLKRSVSPSGRGRRSASASTNPPLAKKARSRSGYKSRGSSTHGSFADVYSDGMNGYSSGDGAPGSVCSRTKSEHLGNTEISLDNIVEGGRRKRAKFESSELPLFAPPQMPAATSNSSVSPARRIEHHRASLPLIQPSQLPFTYPPVLQSPQNYGSGFGQPGIYLTPIEEGRRTRGTAAYPAPRHSISATPNGNSGTLPTPDPTVGSCVSEEDKDVALQLMRLGEMTNNSHGRTSASTLDDAFSGRADAASTTEATSDAESESEDDLLPARRQKRGDSAAPAPGSIKRHSNHMHDALPIQDGTDSGDEAECEDDHDGTFRPDAQDTFLNDFDKIVKAKMPKARSISQGIIRPRVAPPSAKSAKVSKSSKSHRPAHIAKSKTKAAAGLGGSRPPISPTSLPPQSRKASVASALNFQHQLGDDEEDLSSKPRCQRCRKSKKGCDRQRPCQRCKDAGLSADQCVSEDEGNGRKGRYGRHMGVPVKKDELHDASGTCSSGIVAVNGISSDKSKKRKR